ncbi:hypothetical protein B9Z55_018707 [Caenorhabditis nigoni]|uniref:Uncharacterized protein n=1 Tax=Caenorhabditis nigoni TaxID=1611254 RepID=A0A2G5TF70_9PELO|nr:hypothetical protein B9Z55_018707 [Caenorhabditis nigoni]
MLHDETYRSHSEKEICNLKRSIEILKKIPDKLNGNDYFYTDDPENKDIVEACKQERPKISEELEELRKRNLENPDDFQKLISILQELEKLFIGFFTMISEVEIEQSVVEYYKNIELEFEKLCKIVVCMR